MKSLPKIGSKNNILIGFSLIFLVYVLYIIFTYAGKSKVFAYQVKEGELAEKNIYTGLIIRDETIYKCEGNGYINYFAREGEHVGVGDLIYTIDESGAIEDIVNSSQGENSLTNEDLNELRTEASNFRGSFSNANFYKVYDFKYSIKGLVSKLGNMNLLDKLTSNNAMGNIVKMCTAQKAGYVVYNTDGLESVSVNGITSDMFDKATYEKTVFASNDLVSDTTAAYKLINDEEWQVAINITKDKYKSLEGTDYVRVRFLEDQKELNGKVDLIQNGDEYFALLTFNTNVLTYATKRYVDIELLGTARKGLKIPVTSIVHKQFFIIPKEYAIEKGEENTYYFLKKSFKDDGTISAELTEVEVYSETEDSYYVDDTVLKIGDYLLKQDSTSEFPVSTKGELVGVYNINKGYADFRQISILYQNDEYAIVNSNTAYGLNVYDYIVLDSSTVKDEEILYK